MGRWIWWGEAPGMDYRGSPGCSLSLMTRCFASLSSPSRSQRATLPRNVFQLPIPISFVGRSGQSDYTVQYAGHGSAGVTAQVRRVWEEVRALANPFKTFGSLAPPKSGVATPTTRRWLSSAGNSGSGFLVRSTFCWLGLRCRIGGRRCRLSLGLRALLPDLRKGPRH
jgi:hypothetical protein